MASRIVVTGMGLLSALGDSPERFHGSLCEGASAAGPVSLFSPEGFAAQLAGEIRDFDPRAYLGEKNFRPLDRTSRLVASAAQLALADSGWTAEMRAAQEVALVLGTMFCSVHTISEFDRRALTAGPSYVSPLDFANTVINAAAGQTAIWHQLRGMNSTIAAGSASGLRAIGYALEQMRTGRVTTALAGGAEELSFEGFCGFDRAELLARGSQVGPGFAAPFDKSHGGFFLGEGAALLMLEEAGAANARGAKILAEIRGFGSAFDRSRGADEKSGAEAIRRAMQSALDDAGSTSNQIDGVIASAGGGAADHSEALALQSVFGGQDRFPCVTSVKSATGEALGASGAFSVIALLESMRTGRLPGIARLTTPDETLPPGTISSRSREISLRSGIVNSIGLDGNCASLVVTAPERAS